VKIQEVISIHEVTEPALVRLSVVINNRSTC